MRPIFRVLLSAALACLAPAAPAQTIPTIKVAFNAPGDEAKLLMRADPQAFPAIGRDYRIEWLQLQGTATVSQALVVGTADCGISAPLTLAQAIVGAGMQPVLIGAINGESPESFTSYWVVRADSPVTSPAGLKNRTVAVNTIGSQMDVFTRIWLKQNGLDPERDVKIAEVPFPIGETALRQGRVDAAVLVQPFASKAEQTGGLRRLGALRDVQPRLLNLIEVCRKSVVDRHPQAVAQYARDFAAASRRFSDDRAASIQLIADTLKVPVPVLQGFMFTASDFQRYPDGAIELPVIQKSFDLFHDNGMLARRLDAADYVRPGVTLVAPGRP
ncbi:MAG: ABC transporter substrate-binding protein [Lautropia sp.]